MVIFAIYAITWLLFSQFIFGKGQQNQAPVPVAQRMAELQKQEAELRKADPNVSLSDRVKKLDQISKDYETVYQAHQKTPDGAAARFRSINIFDYLSALEGSKAGTHWYDQAELRLKEMEKGFHHQTGEVTIEDNRLEDGKVVTTSRTVSGDLGKLSTEKLNQIRQARDVVNRDKWTYRVLDFFVTISGGKQSSTFSYALALSLIVIILKVITFPFQKKQYLSQRDMQRVAPLIKEVQEKMQGRPPQEVNARVMQIYKENNVSLTAGCIPMLVMMFVLLPVFWMVRDYEYQFVNAQFLWVGSAYSKTVWWLGDNLAQFDVPMFVIYLFSTVAFSLLQPKPADPQQAQTQKIMMFTMPLVFGWFMWAGQWSSAFMLYWLVLNMVSMYQSWTLMRQYGLSTDPQSGPPSGGGEAAEVPATPLQPMKSVHTSKKQQNGSGRGRPTAGRIRPRGAK
jgi:YidC/Oxa1 family membrane protein insertase